MINKKDIENIKNEILNQTFKMASDSSNINVTTAQDNDKKQRYIELTIPLDSWSPIKNFSKDFSYREKLASNIFDFETPIEKQNINCYLDHKMSIENLLASTKNKSMEVTRQDNVIKAKIKIDETNEKLKNVAKWIEEKVVSSNSFIFKALDVEINEEDKRENSDVNMEIVYKKAQLISIDPVYEGFYPQANCQVYNNETQTFQNLQNAIKINQTQKEDIPMENKQTDLETKSVSNSNATDSKVVEIVEKNANTLSEAINAIKDSTIETIKKSAKTDEVLDKIASTLTELKNVKRVSVDDNKLAQFMMSNGNSDELEYRKANTLVWRGAKKTTQQQRNLVFKNNYDKFIDFVDGYDASPLLQLTESMKDIVASSMEQRDLDGTSKLKGLALIQNILQPGILEDMLSLFPEIEGANWIPLNGLDLVRQAIYIRSTSDYTKKAEGEEAENRSGKVIGVNLVASRWAGQLVQNNALKTGIDLWAVQTRTERNTMLNSIRKDFYKTLFTHKAASMSTLETESVSNYTGGVTLEAKVETADKKINWTHIDKMVLDVITEFGQDALDNAIITMHADTFTELNRPFLAGDKNPVYFLERTSDKEFTYRGVKIITSMVYPYKPDATTLQFKTGDIPVAIFNKKNISVYGCTINIFDDPYTQAGKDQTRRIIQTRGEVKLTDPYITSRFLQIK